MTGSLVPVHALSAEVHWSQQTEAEEPAMTVGSETPTAGRSRFGCRNNHRRPGQCLVDT